MLQRQRPDLGVENLKIKRVHRGLRRPATHADGLCQQLRLLFRGLDERHAKLWDPLRQRLLVFDRGERHLCLEARPMIASRSLHRLAPWFAPWGVGEARRPRSPLSEFPGPPLPGGIQEQQLIHREYTLLPNEGVS